MHSAVQCVVQCDAVQCGAVRAGDGEGEGGCEGVATSSACPGRVALAFLLLRTSHNLMVLSLLAVTRRRLSEDQHTRYTAAACPVSVATNVPLMPSQTFTFLSKEAEAKYRPSGEN